MKPLKELYELLWEQIKDNNLPFCLCDELTWIGIDGVITEKEHSLLALDVKNKLPKPNKDGFSYPFNEEGSEQRKEFVQHRIKQLTDVSDKNVVNIKQ